MRSCQVPLKSSGAFWRPPRAFVAFLSSPKGTVFRPVLIRFLPNFASIFSFNSDPAYARDLTSSRSILDPGNKSILDCGFSPSAQNFTGTKFLSIFYLARVDPGPPKKGANKWQNKMPSYKSHMTWTIDNIFARYDRKRLCAP